MYEIVVRGEAGPTEYAAFDDLTVTAEHGFTTFSSELADQAELFGVLARVQALGLELVGVYLRAPGSSGEVER